MNTTIRPVIRDVLADRYASTAMLQIWSEENKIVAGRELWIAVMDAQAELGLNIPAFAIDSYRKHVNNVNLASIRERERKTRHDVKAMIEEFNDLAGYEYAHMGMTSRDYTESVEQMQILQALSLVQFKIITTLSRLATRMLEHIDQPIVGRSHNVPAQMTTLGKRFASAAEELFLVLLRINDFGASYPFRGIKGPVGTQQDMLELFDGNESKVDALEKRIAEYLGFENMFTSVGQVYPRSLDFEVLSLLVQAAAGPSSLAKTIRLMAGDELVTEGFKEGQVGSSAMPHKMNSRSSERVGGFYNVLRGYLTMIEGVAGDQWGEGDVSCSVVRRVAIQGAFFAIDGLFETFLTVLDEFGAYPAVIDREIDRYLPFLATTKLLMNAVKRGTGREAAHACIKKHAIAAAKNMRMGGLDENSMFADLAADPSFPLNREEITAAIGAPLEFTGRAYTQVETLLTTLNKVCSEYPDAVAYKPEPIL